MAEHFSFFDAVLQDDGVTYDREYNAQQFTKYFGVLVTTGVMKGTGNMLAVSANGSNMVTKIDTGIAFVEAKYYENDSFKELTHDTETLGNSRIDRIVIRMDLSTEARYVKSFIKKGVPSTNPVAPTLTQTPNLYEISLAQVKIVGGQTFIGTNAVTDERGINVICPWAGSNILPNFNDATLQQTIETMVNNGKFAWNTTDLSPSGPKPGAGMNIDDIRRTAFFYGTSSFGTTGTLPIYDRTFFLMHFESDGYNSNSYQLAFIPTNNNISDNGYWADRYLIANEWTEWSRKTGMEDTGWIKPSVSVGWTIIGKGYRKIGNEVFIQLDATLATGANSTMFTLPVGMRPSRTISIPAYNATNNKAFTLIVNSQGDVTRGGDFTAASGANTFYATCNFLTD